MINIRYNNSTTMIPVSFSRTENTVTLTGTTEANSSGFHTYRLGGQELGDFSDFTTVYRVTDDSVTYSNDGSVYVEPSPVYEPTVSYEELVASKIRERYSINDELAILRQRDEKPTEYAEYYAYCEQCKTEAKEELNG